MSYGPNATLGAHRELMATEPTESTEDPTHNPTIVVSLPPSAFRCSSVTSSASLKQPCGGGEPNPKRWCGGPWIPWVPWPSHLDMRSYRGARDEQRNAALANPGWNGRTHIFILFA